jgi:hypothetical protein
MIEAFRHCADCDSQREFVQLHPDPGSCPDARDGSCPEWICGACGTGVLVAIVPLARAA